MTKRSTAPARAFAVLALIGGFVVLLVIVSAALSGGDSDDGSQSGSPGNVSRQATTPEKEVPKAYVIENGDTLTAIAHKTGVPVAHDRTAQSRSRPPDPDLRRKAQTAVSAIRARLLAALVAVAAGGAVGGPPPRKL